jgi:hypothetical protein
LLNVAICTRAAAGGISGLLKGLAMSRAQHNRQSQAQMQKRPALRPGAALRCVSVCGVGAFALADRSPESCSRKAGRMVAAGLLALETSTTTRSEITRIRIAGQVSNRCKPYLGAFVAVCKPNLALSVRNGEPRDGQAYPSASRRE